MNGSRLQAVHVTTRDVAAARRLWVDLLGAAVVDETDDRVSVALPHGVTLTFRHGEIPGVTAAELAVPDPDHAAGRLRDTLGLAVVDDQGGCWSVDARAVLGGWLSLVPLGRDPLPTPTGGGAAGVETFDHLCFGVTDLGRASDALRAVGGVPVFGGDSPYGIRSLHLTYDVGKLELLTPLREDSEVGRYLARRGGSAPHHLTLLVKDVPAAQAAAHELGYETTWTNLDHDSWKDTYLRPGSTDGLVIQLAVTTQRYATPLSQEDYDRIFAGYWWVAYHEMRPKAEVQT